MEEKFQLLKSKYLQLIQSEFITFSDVVLLKNIAGVYIIYNRKQEIIYIGSTNKFHIRFGVDLKHESTHILIRKLIRNQTFTERQNAIDFIKNDCRMKIVPCQTKREAEALEHFAIFILNPPLNK